MQFPIKSISLHLIMQSRRTDKITHDANIYSEKEKENII